MLINKLGLIGIGIIKVFVFFALFVLTYLKGQSYYRIKIPSNKIIISVLVLIVNFGIGYILGYGETSLIIKIITLIMSILGLWSFLPFFSKEEKTSLLNNFKKT